MVGPSSAVNATLYDKLNFVFLRDVAPVASLIRQPQIMLANPSVTTQTVPELIAYAKANPGRITMASAGGAAAGHVRGENYHYRSAGRIAKARRHAARAAQATTFCG